MKYEKSMIGKEAILGTVPIPSQQVTDMKIISLQVWKVSRG